MNERVEESYSAWFSARASYSHEEAINPIFLSRKLELLLSFPLLTSALISKVIEQIKSTFQLEFIQSVGFITTRGHQAGYNSWI